MSAVVPAVPLGGVPLPQPGANLHVGNLVGAAKIAEKTVELTACAQFGTGFGTDIVWFGLTQAQERQHGFDAATNLGGRAFILQFKVSATVPQSGSYPRQRRFTCQHHQMTRLVTTFGAQRNSCFYFLPNIGRFGELVAANGDVLSNSYLLDVADLPNPLPQTQRKSGYHYAYLDSSLPMVTITSEPFNPKRLWSAREWLKQLQAGANEGLPRSKELMPLAQRFDRENTRLGDLFYKNAALAVIPSAD